MPIKGIEVAVSGLAAIARRRGAHLLPVEIVSNCLDEDGVTRVTVTLVSSARGRATFIVEDDGPHGWFDVSHAWTMFADSYKRKNPQQRGRFNAGEKLVLSLCDDALIQTMQGTVKFTEDGREFFPKERRERGTRFNATMRLTKSEVDEAVQHMRKLLLPDGVTLTINNAVVAERPVKQIVRATLMTEVEDKNDPGVFRRSARAIDVHVVEPVDGEKPHIYEMGIPVVEHDGAWHYDVQQRVPLNIERDNVTPAYLRDLHTAVLNGMVDVIDADMAAESWTTTALSDPNVSQEAAAKVVLERFGPNPFTPRPGDDEGKRLALADNRTCVTGRMLPKEAWANVKRFDLIQPPPKSPAVTLGEHMSEGKFDPDFFTPEDKWTEGMKAIASYCEAVGDTVFGRVVLARWISDVSIPAAAYHQDAILGSVVTFNKVKLGQAWIDRLDQEAVDRLVLHEVSHFVGDHLSPEYHQALAKYGAKWISLARQGKAPSLAGIYAEAAS